MKLKDIHTEVLQNGDPPPCLETMQQCRGCFGWSNMQKAAYDHDIWRKYPLKCPCTGLVLKVVCIETKRINKRVQCSASRKL